MKTDFDPDGPVDIAWCPGCGDYSIIGSLKKALAELGTERKNIVLVSGIGQAAKTPHYVNVNFLDGLHGRSLPLATAIKASNPGLTVIAVSGDGCMYSEGGNHFIHAIRRNPDLTQIVHNNMVYGLTKGQASPTSRRGFKTPVQITGVYLEPINPIAIAISLKASFVARALSDDMEKTKELIMRAVRHRGYSLIDVFQPCVTFNRVNTREWFKEHTYYVGDDYDPRDRDLAFRTAMLDERFALGVLYLNEENKTFEENLAAYRRSDLPLYQRIVDTPKLQRLIDSYIAG